MEVVVKLKLLKLKLKWLVAALAVFSGLSAMNEARADPIVRLPKHLSGLWVESNHSDTKARFLISPQAPNYTAIMVEKKGVPGNGALPHNTVCHYREIGHVYSYEPADTSTVNHALNNGKLAPTGTIGYQVHKVEIIPDSDNSPYCAVFERLENEAAKRWVAYGIPIRDAGDDAFIAPWTSQLFVKKKSCREIQGCASVDNDAQIKSIMGGGGSDGFKMKDDTATKTDL